MPKDYDKITIACGFSMGRCPDCDRVHMAFLNENDEVFAEMVLDDDQWLGLIEHLRKTVEPRNPGRMM
jgi:hypothetical protein